jgi:hypothetical protein
MTERRPPPEQSMEEILASIRRIISDDGVRRPLPGDTREAKVEPVIDPLGPVPGPIPLHLRPRGGSGAARIESAGRAVAGRAGRRAELTEV